MHVVQRLAVQVPDAVRRTEVYERARHALHRRGVETHHRRRRQGFFPSLRVDFIGVVLVKLERLVQQRLLRDASVRALRRGFEHRAEHAPVQRFVLVKTQHRGERVEKRLRRLRRHERRRVSGGSAF